MVLYINIQTTSDRYGFVEFNDMILKPLSKMTSATSIMQDLQGNGPARIDRQIRLIEYQKACANKSR